MSLVISRVPLDALTLDPSNARAHGPANLQAIEASLKRFGQTEPLVVQAGSRRVIGGNGRLVAMRSLGWEDCEVVELEIDDLQATALGIALNRTGELAEWDDPVLARLLEQLRSEGALEGVGYDEADIDALLADLEEDAGEVEEDEAPEPPEDPVSRLGDLWILGEHRLLCGDSTNPEDVARLMGNEQAALVATDPPYLVDYTGERPNDSGKNWSDNYREIDIKDAEGFFRAVFTQVRAVIAPNSAIYCWHAHKRTGVIQRVWEELEILDHQQIIWVKPTPVFGRVYYHFRHEPCMMGWVKGSKPEHDGAHDHDSVWEIDWEGKARYTGDHPTTKPVKIFARPIRKHTKRGDVVFEPFSGSGSQIMAAEQLGRQCRAMEISPAFVDVAIQRWSRATGKAPILESTCQDFDQVARDRA